MIGEPPSLSRAQFAWVVAFHFLLPAFTVGLASFIAVLEGLHLATGREIYFRVSMFWIKIFAVSFGMVVSGIVMPFQFGTNWSRFSDASADVISPLLAYEGLLWQAASSPSTQAFLLVGTLFLLPIVLLYTAWSYWVFRGKVRGDLAYH